MSRHLQDLLEELKGRLARMSAIVQQIVEKAVESIVTGNPRLAQEVIDDDARVDDEEVKIEQASIDLLALHQPAACDLRFVTTVIKINSDLERIADCACNAAQRVIPLARADRYVPPPDLRMMGNSVIATLRDTIKSMNLRDSNLARQVLRGDDVVDALYHQILQDMVAKMEAGGQDANTELSNIMIAKNLERIADHCTNIAEDVIYILSGRIIRHLHAV